MTVLAAEEIRRFGIEPKAALLSHSNFGSRDSAAAPQDAPAPRQILKRIAPDLMSDGEMHGDSALSELLRNRVYPHSRPEGRGQSAGLPEPRLGQHRADHRQDDDGCPARRADPARHRHAGAHPDPVGDLARHRQHDGARRGRGRPQGAGGGSSSLSRAAGISPYRKERVNFAAPSSATATVRGGGRMRRPGEKALRGAAALAAGLLLAVFADPSLAASSRTCRQLEAELASAGKGGRQVAVPQIRARRGRAAPAAGDRQGALSQRRLRFRHPVAALVQAAQRADRAHGGQPRGARAKARPGDLGPAEP